MAFWAVYGKPWFKRKFPNMILLFKEYLFREWYNSLSDEDKVRYQRRVKAQQEKHEERFRQACLSLSMMGAFVSSYGKF